MAELGFIGLFRAGYAAADCHTPRVFKMGECESAFFVSAPTGLARPGEATEPLGLGCAGRFAGEESLRIE